MRRKRPRREKWAALASYVALSAYCFLVIFPVFWVVENSFKNKVEMTDYTHAFRFTATLANYETLFRLENFLHLMLNSLIVMIGATAITVPVAFSAAYALVRWPWRGAREMALGLLASRMLPPATLILPLYTLFRLTHLLNTRVGLVIAYISFTVPFATWLLRGYLQNVPKDYEESAMIDGLGPVQAVFRIVLPMSAPGVVTAALFSSLSAWSEFLFALILTLDSSAQTAPVGVAGLISALGVEWGQLLAASTLLLVPMIILVIISQRYLVEGLSVGLK